MKSVIPPQRSDSRGSAGFFAGTRLIAGLLLLQLLSVSMLWAQAPKPPASPVTSAAPLPKISAYANAHLTYKITPAPVHTFGYDVYIEGRLMIHQTSVPALPGAEGFKTKAAAKEVAQLVIEKIRKGEMPPTVSIDEMKRLNAIK